MCYFVRIPFSDGKEGVCRGCRGEQPLPRPALGARSDGTRVGGGSDVGSYRSAVDVEAQACGGQCALSVAGLPEKGNQLLPFGVELNDGGMVS